MYYTYMLRCSDNSIYTGMTNNLENRINEHLSNSKSLACKLEYQIKNLTKQQKENLINGEKLTTYLKGKIDGRRYRKI